MGSEANVVRREPWTKGKIVGQKAPFKPKDIWALRVRFQIENRIRELALFNLGSTASFAAVISFHSECAMSVTGIRSLLERS
jgi:hypothetical protein